MAQGSFFEEIRKELFQSRNLEFSITDCKSQRRSQILVQRLKLLRKQSLDSSFHEFMQECSKSIAEKANEDSESVAAWIIDYRELIEGLLDTMGFYQPGVHLFSADLCEKASFVKLSFLFQIFLSESPEIISLPKIPHPPFIVQTGFQLFLQLLQSLKLMPVLSQAGIFWDGAWKLLEYLQQLNQNEWDACSSVVLHQIVSCYVSNGPTTLQEAPMKFLLKLFAKPCFARRFLDSITLCPDFRNSSAERGALNAALQIFEAAYRSSPLVIVTSCASKIVDIHTDSAFLRLECLALLGKLRSLMANNMRGHEALQLWPSEAIHDVITSVLKDSSVRVRRSAFQLLLQIEPPEVDEKELLYTVFMKIRDEDEKVKLLAFQRLLRFPMKLLHLNFRARDWKLIFHHAIAHEGSHIYRIAKDLLLKYLYSDSVPPSRRLKMLDFAKNDNYQKYGKLIGNHIAEIFEMEVKFLDAYCYDDEDDQNTVG